MPSVEWSRDTEWRQGYILSQEGFSALFPEEALQSRHALVITHDCDLAAEFDRDPDVEFLLGSIYSSLPPGVSGEIRAGQSSRLLYLTLKDERVLELHMKDRKIVSKERLLPYSPDRSFQIGKNSLDKLQNWLAARYRRAALPDYVNEALAPVFRAFKNEGKKSTCLRVILGVYLHFEPTESEPKDFDFLVVHSTDWPNGREIAENYKAGVEKSFGALNPTLELNVSIQIRNPAEVTLEDLRTHKEIHLEYLSYRE